MRICGGPANRSRFAVLGLISGLLLSQPAAQAADPKAIAPPATPPAAGPNFSFADPTVRIPAGVAGWTAEITLKSDVDVQLAPVIKDADKNEPIKFLWEEENPAGKRLWIYAVSVAGTAPSAPQLRYAIVTFGDSKTQMLSYTLTSSAASFSWSIAKPADPWVKSPWWFGGSCTEFVVTPKDSLASGLVVNSTLAEQTSKTQISPGALSLCRPGDQGKCDVLKLNANTPTTLRLCTRNSFGIVRFWTS